MFNKTFIGLSLLALALSACAPAAQVTEKANPSATSTRVATPTSQPALTSNPEKKPGCTAKSRRSEPNPTLEALLPPPGESDWVEGPSDAYVTIIEYGDYQ